MPETECRSCGLYTESLNFCGHCGAVLYWVDGDVPNGPPYRKYPCEGINTNTLVANITFNGKPIEEIKAVATYQIKTQDELRQALAVNLVVHGRCPHCDTEQQITWRQVCTSCKRVMI